MKISKTTLYVDNVEQMKKFYCNQLGFKLLNKTSTSFEIEVGESILACKLALPYEQKQYHFAFNIPSNLFAEAKDWVKLHTTLLTDNGEDEVFFERINAYSLYFYDPEDNVVELIARHAVNPVVQVEKFSARTILSIGEINLTTDDLLNVGQKLIDIGVPVRDNDPLNVSSLNFMGESDTDAYILLGPSRRNWYFSTKDAIVSRIIIEVNHQLRLEVDEDGKFQYYIN